MLLLLLLLVLFFFDVSSSSSTPSDPAFLSILCNKTSVDEYIVEHPNICTNFISCSYGKVVQEWKCDQGKAWVREHCDLPNPGNYCI